MILRRLDWPLQFLQRNFIVLFSFVLQVSLDYAGLVVGGWRGGIYLNVHVSLQFFLVCSLSVVWLVFPVIVVWGVLFLFHVVVLVAGVSHHVLLYLESCRFSSCPFRDYDAGRWCGLLASVFVVLPSDV